MVSQNIRFSAFPHRIRTTLRIVRQELKGRKQFKKTTTRTINETDTAKVSIPNTQTVPVIKFTDCSNPEATPAPSTPTAATSTKATSWSCSTSSWSTSFSTAITSSPATATTPTKPFSIPPFPSFQALQILEDWMGRASEGAFLQKGVYIILKAAFAPRPRPLEGPMGEKMIARVYPCRGHFRTSRHCQMELLNALNGHYLDAVSAVEYLLSDLYPRKDARDLLRRMSKSETNVDMKDLNKRLNCYFMPKAQNVMWE